MASDPKGRPGIADLLVTILFLAVVSYPGLLGAFISDRNSAGHSDLDVTLPGEIALIALALLSATTIARRITSARRTRTR
jgi:hypothetical protein